MTELDEKAAWDRDGYLMCRGLFSREEIGLLGKIARADREKAAQVSAREGPEGGESRLWLTSDTSRRDIYNAICRGSRVAGRMTQLLEDEVYLYHYKAIIKEPHVGGAWVWHQDYGYWYNNGCLFPNMASCFVAIDRAHTENGCLQVIRGSHRMGRIEHGRSGDQTGADSKRVDLALQHLDLVHCEMAPGDALFFHCNTLHRSDRNLSEDPRWSLICCYNARNNPCLDLPGHPSYRALELWDDSEVLATGQAQLQPLESELRARE